jgi:hypothetical protein
VAAFWSLTLYDNETRSQIRNDQDRPLVGSLHGTIENEDGSVDVLFSPELPEGIDERNWVQTRPGNGWFAYLRLYGPEQAFFDRTWLPSDFERVE